MKKIRPCYGPELADIFDQLNRVQSRLQPYSERYYYFMREDPAYEGVS